jgi:hypothetical protein
MNLTKKAKIKLEEKLKESGYSDLLIDKIKVYPIRDCSEWRTTILFVDRTFEAWCNLNISEICKCNDIKIDKGQFSIEIYGDNEK